MLSLQSNAPLIIRRMTRITLMYSLLLGSMESKPSESATPTRSESNPLVTIKSSDSLGNNVNGPAIIRVPSWVKNPLGRYYLYFAHHRGSFIRLAYADTIHGPWTIYEPGTLAIEHTAFVRHQADSLKPYTHIASPEIKIDEHKQTIQMWFHGLQINENRWVSTAAEASKWFEKNGYTQYTQRAESSDGIHFTVKPGLIKESYLRFFSYEGYLYAMGRLGRLLRAKGYDDDFQLGANPFRDSKYAGRVRHLAVTKQGDQLQVFFSAIGDKPERILVSTINLSQDWHDWKSSPPETILEPEQDYECADLPKKISQVGLAEGNVRELRDPYVLEDAGKSFLFYSICGEQGIAVAELGPSQSEQ